MDVAALLQAGGVLAFAAIVYDQLRRQTAIFGKLGENVVKILERQNQLLEKQEEVIELLAGSRPVCTRATTRDDAA